MKNYKTIGMAVLALTVPYARAATVGVQYVQSDACGNGTINNTKPDAQGYASWMSFFGHTRKFLLGNSGVWPNDAVNQPSISNGMDSWYADDVNMFYIATHGSSNPTRFFYTAGSTRNIDGISTCLSPTFSTSTNKQWWRLGDKNARIVNLSTCQSLQLEHLAHWDAVAQGLHLLTGFHNNVADSPSIGGNYGFYGNLPGFTVKQAWFAARPKGDTAVVMAYGTSLNDAVNRRENERFSSSMARLGPKTHRAWSWIQ